MSPSSPAGWFDRLIGLCFSLLLGAAAVYFAVQLIESVWPILLTILGVIGAAFAVLGVIRSRRQGW